MEISVGTFFMSTALKMKNRYDSKGSIPILGTDEKEQGDRDGALDTGERDLTPDINLKPNLNI